MSIDDSILTGAISSAFSIGVTWGIMQARIDAMTRRLDSIDNKIESVEEECVTHKHMDAVVNPIQKVVEEIQKDIKKLLVLVAKKDGQAAERF